MKFDAYIPWIKEVNIELSTYSKCLSCYEIKDSLMRQYFKDGLTSSEVAKELYQQSKARNYCMCIVTNIKKAQTLNDIINAP